MKLLKFQWEIIVLPLIDDFFIYSLTNLFNNNCRYLDDIVTVNNHNLQIVVFPFVLFLLAIVLSFLLRFTDSDYPCGIFKYLTACYTWTSVKPSIQSRITVSYTWTSVKPSIQSGMTVCYTWTSVKPSIQSRMTVCYTWTSVKPSLQSRMTVYYTWTLVMPSIQSHKTVCYTWTCRVCWHTTVGPKNCQHVGQAKAR